LVENISSTVQLRIRIRIRIRTRLVVKMQERYGDVSIARRISRISTAAY